LCGGVDDVCLKISERNSLGSAGGISLALFFRPPRLEPERKERLQVFLWWQIYLAELVFHLFNNNDYRRDNPQYRRI
jgi:hypothetical protein